MILYKYMSLETAKNVIESNSLGFTCLEDFNDPFEGTAFGFLEPEGGLVSASTVVDACRNRFSRNYAVLSLTRQPLNALMWSHYGDSHHGAVIGIDVSITDFGLTEENLIPYQCGEIIYTATINQRTPIIETDVLMSIGNQIAFESDIFNLVKRAFLYKSLEWAYEEEVRVIKNISEIGTSYHCGKGQYGVWNKIDVSGRPLYCYPIPKEAIREVYLGINSYKNVSRRGWLTEKEYSDLIESWRKNFRVMFCGRKENSWDLTAWEK